MLLLDMERIKAQYEALLTDVVSGEYCDHRSMIRVSKLAKTKAEREWLLNEAGSDSWLDVRTHGRYGYVIMLGQWMKE